MTHKHDEIVEGKVSHAAGAKRDITIDILRLLGLIGVILAHCSIPGPLFELREFDVTMLVLASGMSYACVRKKDLEPVTVHSWFSYVVKRFQRLVAPVWIFLVFYFLFFRLVFGISYDWRYILSSFALTSGGIQFVWVFRVFFTSAILNPLLDVLVFRKGTVWSAVCFMIVLALNEVLLHLNTMALSGMTLKLLNYVLFYTVSYAMISGLGIVLQQMEPNEKRISLLICALIWTGLGIGMDWPSLQVYKYPPQLYYISYGLFVTVIIDLFFAYKMRPSQNEGRWLLWLSRHSMDIYLAHIFVIYFVQALSLSTSLFWGLQFLVYFGGSIVLVLLFQLLMRIIHRPRDKGQGS